MRCCWSAVTSAVVGYVAGARLAAQMPAEQVICWVLVLSPPLTLPVTLLAWPVAPVRAMSWGAFCLRRAVLDVAGFFAWYRGLALGGMVRVSQVQLAQPLPRCWPPCRCWANI